MSTWKEIAFFAGFDWAKDHHDVVVLDGAGKIAVEFRFEHTAAGWALCRQKLEPFQHLAVAVEAGQMTVMERLASLGHRVYPVHPRSSKSYRLRKQPSGAKTDRGDCWALAEALRFEGEGWHPLETPEPMIQRLRLLCRDEVALIEQRTALVNQLQQALYEYYPAALEAFDNWTHVSAWAFVERFPTPQTLAKAGKRQWEKFLHAHALYHPERQRRRLEVFSRAHEFCGDEATTAAKSVLAVALAKLLQTLERQLTAYRSEISACFKQHPEHHVFASLPGAGPKLAPRLLAELVAMKSMTDQPGAVQCLAGMAPVSYQSGKVSVVYLRRQCNRFLRATVHLWADLSRHYCEWARIYYDSHRKNGQSHACAVRCLGMRWLKILCAMLRNKESYNAELHARNQLRHGSWVLRMEPKPAHDG